MSYPVPVTGLVSSFLSHAQHVKELSSRGVGGGGGGERGGGGGGGGGTQESQKLFPFVNGVKIPYAITCCCELWEVHVILIFFGSLYVYRLGSTSGYIALIRL